MNTKAKPVMAIIIPGGTIHHLSYSRMHLPALQYQFLQQLQQKLDLAFWG